MTGNWIMIFSRNYLLYQSKWWNICRLKLYHVSFAKECLKRINSGRLWYCLTLTLKTSKFPAIFLRLSIPHSRAWSSLFHTCCKSHEALENNSTPTVLASLYTANRQKKFLGAKVKRHIKKNSGTPLYEHPYTMTDSFVCPDKKFTYFL